MSKDPRTPVSACGDTHQTRMAMSRTAGAADLSSDATRRTEGIGKRSTGSPPVVMRLVLSIQFARQVASRTRCHANIAACARHAALALSMGCIQGAILHKGRSALLWFCQQTRMPAIEAMQRTNMFALNTSRKTTVTMY